MSERSTNRPSSEVSDKSLGRCRKDSIFSRQFVDFCQLALPRFLMPEDSKKNSSGIPLSNDTYCQPAKDEHPSWEAQLWNVHCSTMQDPAWRLRFKIWLNSSSLCVALNCPIKTPHNQGRYLHEGELGWEIESPFGSSNPTPEIWEAKARIQSGKCTDEDLELVDAFLKLHVGQGDFGPI